MKKLSFMFLLLLLIVACSGAPKIRYSDLQIDASENSDHYQPDDVQFMDLMKKTRGARFGERLFNNSTQAYWLIPKIHKMDLDLTAEDANFSSEEYQRRLENLKSVHDQYLIFSVDLRVPLNPKWTKDELIGFFQDNLVITLDIDQHKGIEPATVNFRTIERFQDKEVERLLSGARNVEVGIPIRLLFKKEMDSQNIITPNTRKLVLRLRLKQPPPYNIGYFDERLFQGFIWKVVRQ